jgi:peptidoglycan/xylan/chitin deacetylase (PgdA/CDA1 family)
MDWVHGIEKQEVIKNVLDNVRPGEIIIMHSGPGQKTVIDALPEIIKGLRVRGFSIVDLGTMLGVSAYK